MTTLLIPINLLVLLAEGWLLAGLLLPSLHHPLRLSLALPLAAVSNVLLFFLFTIVSIPLTFATTGIGHGAIIVILAAFAYRRRTLPVQSDASNTFPHESGQPRLRVMRYIGVLLLLNIAAFSIAHALLLPTFSIDSFTNWTMRSKISFVDQRIAFDTNEDRGMSKPQYPFLTHALQIAANVGQPAWNDRAANGVTWLLSLSAFGALFSLVRRLRGTSSAILTLTLILSIPLLSIHLAQGYGDIHLIEYLLLALATCSVAIVRSDWRWMILSALFILGAMWTKSEGLYFGYAPWALLLLIFAVRQGKDLRIILLLLLSTFALFAPFFLLLHAKGLPLTPHETDFSFAWHPEGLSALIPSLFGGGSFGMMWFALPIASVFLLIGARRGLLLIARPLLPFLLWGWLIVLENLFIYLCTPNVTFLTNGESFFRQMLPAVSLLILACVLIIRLHPLSVIPDNSE